MKMSDFQRRIEAWVRNVFTRQEAFNIPERALSVAEEAIELAQACGVTRGQLHRLVDYVMNRPVGYAEKEIAGVMTTTYAIASALHIEANLMLECEIQRINTPDVMARVRERLTEKREAMGRCGHISPTHHIQCDLPAGHTDRHVGHSEPDETDEYSWRNYGEPNIMDAPEGPRCSCGRPATHESGWCGVIHPGSIIR